MAQFVAPEVGRWSRELVDSKSPCGEHENANREMLAAGSYLVAGE
jgi:hypothetical protein